MTHTPGPWHFARFPHPNDEQLTGFRVYGDGDNVAVCESFPRPYAAFASSDDDARLIAQSPAMLSALDECDTAFATINICDDLTPQARRALRDAWALVNRVMSEATGKPDRFAEANPTLESSAASE